MVILLVSFPTFPLELLVVFDHPNGRQSRRLLSGLCHRWRAYGVCSIGRWPSVTGRAYRYPSWRRTLILVPGLAYPTFLTFVYF